MTLTRAAEYFLVLLFTLLLVFHVLIITSIIPYDIVWGSRLSSSQEMIVFELISLALNVFFLSVILMHAQIIRPILSTKVLKILIWVMMGLFILNTLGNLVSENDFEKLAFTPVTILLSIALYIVAKSKKGMSSLN